MTEDKDKDKIYCTCGSDLSLHKMIDNDSWICECCNYDCWADYNRKRQDFIKNIHLNRQSIIIRDLNIMFENTRYPSDAFVMEQYRQTIEELYTMQCQPWKLPDNGIKRTNNLIMVDDMNE